MLKFFYILLSVTVLWVSVMNLISLKVNTKEKIVMVIVIDLITYLSSCISESIILLITTICMVICIYIKTKKIIISVGGPILATIILVISDIIISHLKVLVFKGPVQIDRNSLEYLFLYLGVFIISFIISKILGILLNKKIAISIENIKGKSAVLIILSLVLTFAIILLNIIIGQKNGFTNESVRINLILFTIYFILLMIIMFTLISSIKKEIKLENVYNEFKNLQEYTKNVENLYNDMRIFKHDYINIISSMAGYIENNDIKGLSKHFSENIMPLSEGMESNNFKIGFLQNIKIPEIKGIIASKIIRAQEAGIDISIEVMEPIENIFMDIIDLSRSVGILIDNAIEAAQKCEKPSIKLGIINKENSVVIVLINSTPEDTPPIYKLYKKGFSTKGENRGLGLNNLKEIIRKYNYISLDTAIKGCEFTQLLEIKNKI